MLSLSLPYNLWNDITVQLFLTAELVLLVQVRVSRSTANREICLTSVPDKDKSTNISALLAIMLEAQFEAFLRALMMVIWKDECVH